jgi:hypothetical protein
MSKFKVGDKVKCIEGQGGPYCLMYGEEYIIVKWQIKMSG